MERLDDLQTGGLRILQDTDLFCFSTDAVLLADYARVQPRDRVIDFGAAGGILDLLMYARQPNAHYTAVELQPALYSLLVRNIALNGLERFITPVAGDIKDVKLQNGRHYDVCVCNPPYEKTAQGEARQSPSQEAARKEVCITLAEICQQAARILRFGGRFYICSPASRLAELCFDLKSCGLEPKTMRLVQAAPEREARLALLMAARGGREGMRVEPPLCLRDGNGRESAELHKIYSRGENCGD
ncbi:MAG: methyltransferase [Clostridia bacterium]|nr:methyltransferase [Clostridia bacterium]